MATTSEGSEREALVEARTGAEEVLAPSAPLIAAETSEASSELRQRATVLGRRLQPLREQTVHSNEHKPTLQDHREAQEVIHATRTLRVTAANDKLAHWRALQTFVHVTEETGLLQPMDCPCGKFSCVQKERYFMTIFPLLMFVGFIGIVYGMISEDGTTSAVNGTSIAAVNATTLVNATADASQAARNKLLADSIAASKDIAVITAVGAMLTTTSGAFIVFCVIRPRVPALYAHRNADEFPLNQGCLSWLPQLISMNEHDLLGCVGFDAFMFLRLPQLACKFCTFAFFPMGLPLMLVNFYAEGDTTATTSLKSLTLSNIPPGSRLLWVYVVAAWYIAWLLLKLVDEEQRVYIRARHLYFHQARPQDYSVFVQDLPPEVRTSGALTRLFKQFYPEAEIHSACVLPDCRKLDGMMAKAENMSKNLAELVAADTDGKKKTRTCCGQQISTTIPKLKAQLAEANNQIRLEQQAVVHRMHTSREAEKAANISLLEQAAKELGEPMTSTAALAMQEKKRIELETKKRIMQAQAKSEKFPLIQILYSAICGAVDQAHGDTRQHGIVTFCSLRTATIARQVIHDSHKLNYQLTVKEAMDPHDIQWQNAGMDFRERLIRSKLGTAMDVWLLALWSVPVVAITGLCSPTSISRMLPFLEDFVNTPSIKAFMEGTLPSIILTQCLNYLPAVLRFTSIYEGLPTKSEVDRHTVMKYFFFLVFNVYLLTTFSGGLIEGLEELLENPKELPNVLAKTLPSQSNFFLSYILINGITTWSVAILQAGDMIKCWLLKQPYEPDLTLNGVGVVGRTETTVVSSKLLLILLLAINFATVAPIVMMPTAMSAAVIYVVHKFLFVYVTTPVFESGGQAWHLYAQCIVFGLGLAQFMLFGMFSLKQGYAQGACMWPLLMYTYHHFIDVSGRYEEVAANLPLLECHAVGELEGRDEADKDLSFLHHAYYPQVMTAELPKDATAGTKWGDATAAKEPAPPRASENSADVEHQATYPPDALQHHDLTAFVSESTRFIANTSTNAAAAVFAKRP